MVEKSLEGSSWAGPQASPYLADASTVLYGITAARWDAGQITEVMMGMFDPEQERWELRPAPTRVVDVVDRLVEGDRVFTLFPTECGTLRGGPEVKVDVLPEGTETLALAEECTGQRLADLPRF